MNVVDESVKTICGRYRRGDYPTMKQSQVLLDDMTGVKTIAQLHVAFLARHNIASRRFGDLLTIMADAVKTAVKKKASAYVTPIDITADGTMALPPEEPAVKQVSGLDMGNFGSQRLGVAVTCDSISPFLGFKVFVGPFFELQQQVQASVAAMKK